MIFLRTSTTASSSDTSCGDDDDRDLKPKSAKKSKMAAEDDTDISHDEHLSEEEGASGQAVVVVVKTDQSPNSTSRHDDGEDAFKNSFKSNKTHETSSLNTIDPILVEDDHSEEDSAPKPAELQRTVGL